MRPRSWRRTFRSGPATAPPYEHHRLHASTTSVRDGSGRFTQNSTATQHKPPEIRLADSHVHRACAAGVPVEFEQGTPTITEGLRVVPDTRSAPQPRHRSSVIGHWSVSVPRRGHHERSCRCSREHVATQRHFQTRRSGTRSDRWARRRDRPARNQLDRSRLGRGRAVAIGARRSGKAHRPIPQAAAGAEPNSGARAGPSARRQRSGLGLIADAAASGTPEAQLG